MTSNAIGITLGDPAGIGPEITAKAIAEMPGHRQNRIVVIGDADGFRRAAALVGFDPALVEVGSANDAGLKIAHTASSGPITPGELSAEGGDGAYRAVAAAVDLAVGNQIGCIVTAPLNKAALHLAGHNYDGHTGLLAHLTGRESGYMLLASERLNTIHVSTHVSLEEATRLASRERLLAVIEAATAHFKSVGIADPRVAVAGMNPHCGESGIFGQQEIETIGPAVAEAAARGWSVSGPISGDTVFYRASRGEFDVVVAQYHDQGHIPVKLIAFETAVNVTLGLPIRRTSVDHGTAFDIAGKGIADATNMGSAIGYAFRMIDAAAQA